MSKGNVNTYGNKKNNFPFQQSVLLLLDALATASSSSGLAQEATLISVLNAIITTQQDIEILLVRDTGNSDVVLQQITDYSGGAPVVTYKDVNGNVVVPVGPLEYLDPAAVLNLILTELLDQGVSLDSIVTSTGLSATEVTQLLVDANLTLLNTKLNTLGQKASADSAPVVLSTEQEVILDGIAADLALIYTNLQLNTVATQNMLTNLATEATLLDVETAIDAVNTKLTSVVRTPSLQRISGVAAASIAAGARSASFFNAGPTDATVAGGTLKPGESITFDAGAQGDTLGAIAYVTIATGDLVITTVV